MLECTNFRNRGKSSVSSALSESDFPQDWYSLCLILSSTGKDSFWKVLWYLWSFIPKLCSGIGWFPALWFDDSGGMSGKPKLFSVPRCTRSGNGCRQVGTGIISRGANGARCSSFYYRLKKRVRAGAGESTCEFTPWELRVLCSGQCRS